MADAADLSIVVVGGGTSGHIVPALAVADVLRSRGATVCAIGTPKGLESTQVPAAGYELHMIDPVPIPRKLSPALFRVPGLVAKATKQAADILTSVKADAVIGFGGYASAPVYVAARRLGIPFFVHEANARAGMANKLGVRLGGQGLAAVPNSGLRAEVVGNPVREAIATLDRAALRAQAREFFGLRPDGPVLLVTGGSQGARSLNNAVLAAAEYLDRAGVQVLHAYGKKNDVTAPSTTNPYIAVPFIERMDLALSAADMILCRSGAMTVAENSAVGIPAVYVPLPHGNGEQALNAMPVVDAAGAMLVYDGHLNAEYIRETLIPVITNPDMLSVMEEQTRTIGAVNAASVIADKVLAAARTQAGKHQTAASDNPADQEG